MRPSSPQPNIDAGGDFGPRFWLPAPATGPAAGLAAGLPMRLLALVQGLAWGEGAGEDGMGGDGMGSCVAATSAAARYADLLRVPPPDGTPLTAVHEAGRTVGPIDAARARSPRPGDGPPVTATAGDLVVDEARKPASPA